MEEILKIDVEIKVMGLGYVGLTLAISLADVGFKVQGIDTDKNKIKKLSQGQPTIYEPQIDHMLNSAIKNNKIEFLDTINNNKESVVYIICVGTPIAKPSNEPNLDNLNKVIEEIGKNLKKEDLVIVRSTVPIGTTTKIIKPTLEKISKLSSGQDFSLASAPERTLQGSALQELRQLSQIIGGVDHKSVEKASLIFGKLTRTIVKVSSIEAAELIKLLDNTYRDITISIGNLSGKICNQLGLDAREVIESANYGYSRNKILLPGAGVGGGCLVKDPYLLLASVKGVQGLDLIKNARIINDSMIDDTIELIKSGFKKTDKNILNSKILVLGFAFKGTPFTDDIRFSPTIPIIKFLKDNNAEVFGYDPVVSKEDFSSLNIKQIKDIYQEHDFDCVIIMNNNPNFKNIDFKKLFGNKNNSLVIDGWYMYDKDSLEKIGIRYFALGSPC